jgi:hypothetical protein
MARIALAANLNLVMFYGFDGLAPPFSRVVGLDLTLPLAALNVALFALLMVITLRRSIAKS